MGKQGLTVRDQLEGLARNGEPVPRLDNAPPFPRGLEHVWRWFTMLDATRDVGMAVNAINYREITAWNGLLGARITPFEVSCIRALDGVRLKWANRSNNDG